MKNIIVIIEKVVSLLSGLFILIRERLLINEVKRQQETNDVEDKATDVNLREENIEELNKELGYIASTATKKRITKNANIKRAQPKKIVTKKTTKQK